jgi:hypothetical protein
VVPDSGGRAARPERSEGLLLSDGIPAMLGIVAGLAGSGMLLFALLGKPGLGWSLMFGALGLGALAFAYRYATMRCEITSDGVRVRQWPTDVTVPFDDIESIDVAPGNNSTGMTYCLGVRRRSDGRLIRAFSVQGYGKGNSDLQRAVLLARQALERSAGEREE